MEWSRRFVTRKFKWEGKVSRIIIRKSKRIYKGYRWFSTKIKLRTRKKLKIIVRILTQNQLIIKTVERFEKWKKSNWKRKR